MRLYAPKSAVLKGKWARCAIYRADRFRPRSVKKPRSPERAIRNESSGHCECAALAAFQRDLLGQHDVPDRQIAHRQKTQPKRRTAVFIDLADVRRSARTDPVLLASVAAADVEIALFRELCVRRCPLSGRAAFFPCCKQSSRSSYRKSGLGFCRLVWPTWRIRACG